ncbi:MAG: hydrogen gas-evolving membrane-bound hydrogenase subunit E [Candidatus Omnitrophota bacterium]
MIELHIILLLMIAAAVVAMEIEDLLSSIIALGAVGFGLTLEFLLLRAPDLAITQSVVEILALVILIRAAVNVGVHPKKIKSHPAYLIFALLFVGTFLFFSKKAIMQLPNFGEPLMKVGAQYIAEAVKRTGATNIVAAVILDFRGYDTLGEATILFTSVIGVLAVLRKTGRKSESS